MKSTGFGQALVYFLPYDGKLYDSKAIIGYAHGVSTGVPLGPEDFSGGDKTVAQRLETLGFTVLNLRRPNRRITNMQPDISGKVGADGP